ncbi:MAG: hypothetical protein ACOY4D_11660 [Pseudomonadota bacterium]
MKTLFTATLLAACALSQPALAQSPQPTVPTMAALQKLVTAQWRAIKTPPIQTP